MKIVPAEDFGVIATMKHKCGHEEQLFYAAETFAISDQAAQELRPCLSCLGEEKNMLDTWRVRVAN